MCRGVMVGLACGHVLEHITRPCPGRCGSLIPDRDEDPAIQGDNRYEEIADVCAPCHAAGDPARVHQVYDVLEADIKARLRAAQAEGRKDEVRSAEKRLREMIARRREALAQARRMASLRAPVGVPFPRIAKRQWEWNQE